MFVAPRGRLLLSADYCQMELRIMTFLAREERMCGFRSDFAVPGPAITIFVCISLQWLLTICASVMRAL